MRARVYYAACAALIGFALTYTLPIYAHLPRTYYDPVARRWFFAANSTPIPMGYVGQIRPVEGCRNFHPRRGRRGPGCRRIPAGQRRGEGRGDAVQQDGPLARDDLGDRKSPR